MVSYTELLHSEKELTQKTADELWNMIIHSSDDLKVEEIREEYGLTNTPKDIYKIISGQRYMTKSKMNSNNWDHKKFQAVYMFGIKEPTSRDAREGINSHLIAELLPEYIKDDHIKSLYNRNKNQFKSNIYKYLYRTSQSILIDTVSNSINKQLHKMQDLKEYFDRIEYYNCYRNTHRIASVYTSNLINSLKINIIDVVLKFWLPKWQEIVIWNNDSWINGIIDAIFDIQYGNYKVVDYKFGKPKNSYFISGINLEMAFYNALAGSDNSEFANDYYSERQKWKPIILDYGEMWHILDTKTPLHKVKFTESVMSKFWEEYYNYWDMMDNLVYPFQENYGYMGNRFEDYCDVKENDDYKCIFRKMCNKATSFKTYKMSQEELIDYLTEMYGGKS